MITAPCPILLLAQSCCRGVFPFVRYAAFIPGDNNGVAKTLQRGVVLVAVVEDALQQFRSGIRPDQPLPCSLWTELRPPSWSPRVQLPMPCMEAKPCAVG